MLTIDEKVMDQLLVFYNVDIIPKPVPNIVLPETEAFDNQLFNKLQELGRTPKLLGKNVIIDNDESFNILNVPEKIPEIQPHDPRFTFGVLLHYLNNPVDENSSPVTTIPTFHWADYVDMSPINDHFLSAEKKNCKWLDQTRADAGYNAKNYIFKPTSYCIEDKDIPKLIQKSTDPIFIENLKQIQNSRFSTGLHVFTIVGRTKSKLRPFVSKSYLHDFMPVPHRMVMLFPESKSLILDISRESPTNRQKLSHALEIHSGQVNIKQEILNIMDKLPPAESTFPAEKQLSHNQFIDKTTEKISELEQSSSLSFSDQQYLNGLKYSLAQKNPGKHFSEGYILKSTPGFSQGAHYDWRFMNEPINKTPKLAMSIHSLLHGWLKFTNTYNLNTWVAHGSLLGWYWNGMQFPWDGDVDVQMPIADLHKLAQSFNQSVVVDFGNDLDTGIRYGRYFIDVTSSISQRAKGNGKNNIDARFIDMDTGLYVDITGLAISETLAPERYNPGLKNSKFGRDKKGVTEMERNNHLQVYNCRNKHFSKLDELSPLKLTLVEGEFSYVPEQFTTILVDEYQTKSLSVRDYRSMAFISNLRTWVDRNTVLDLVSHQDSDRRKRLAKVKVTPDLHIPDSLQLLLDNEDVLTEYLTIRGLTEIHTHELNAILSGVSPSSLFFDENNSLLDLRSTVRDDLFTWISKDKKYDYNEEIKNFIEKCSMSDKKLSIKEEAERLKQSSKQADKEQQQQQKKLQEQQQRQQQVAQEMHGDIVKGSEPQEDPDRPNLLQQISPPRERVGK
ncbi:Protein MNN4 [Spathaspora sp. JA1]|nr:Protein MNN4 [Spathaspora sp. JA1]